MDPNACWRRIADAVQDADWQEAARAADDLLAWIKRDGFPPTITGQPLFDRIVAEQTCQAVAAWSV